MKGLFLFVFSIFLITNLYGQTAQVLNAKTGQPVEGVLLVSEKLTAQTNVEGKVQIDKFPEKSSILFKHSSFLRYSSTKEKIVR